MNITDLRREFDRQALDSAAPGEVRAEAGRRLAARARRRRAQSLIAVAAAVLVVAGGASVVGALLVHGSAGPAASTPVVDASRVPLPADTTLIRYQLQAVQTPVTARAPSKLTGQEWLTSPGRLGVSFFYPDADSRPPYGTTSADTWVQQRVGYVITDTRTDTLQRGGILPPSAVSHRDITVGGHAATLDSAPAATDDTFGFPADRRISWQLTDGRWIHVWTSGLGKEVLTDFAATITERPYLLDRTVRIGLSLPGLTAASSINSSPGNAGFVALCPPGVDPMAIPSAAASGSGSNPSGAEMNQPQTNSGPSSRCITVDVGSGSASLPSPTAKITVGDTVAHVDTASGAAWVDLGHQMTAVVTAPTSSNLSAADLATLAASVQLSPTAKPSPVQTPQEQGHGQDLSGAATPNTPPPPSTHN